MRSADSFATVFEQHRRVLRRQAGRLLRGTGHDPDDVLQDVYLRAHAALESGVVPIEPRAWLLRLVRNACLDELRRVKARPVVDVVLEAVPSGRSGLPDELSDRARGAGAARRHPPPARPPAVRAGDERAGRAVARGGRRAARHHGQHDPLAAGPRPREPPPDRRRPRDRLRVGRGGAGGGGARRACAPARSPAGTCGRARTAARSSAICATRPSRLRRLASWSPWAVARAAARAAAARPRSASAARWSSAAGGHRAGRRVHAPRAPTTRRSPRAPEPSLPAAEARAARSPRRRGRWPTSPRRRATLRAVPPDAGGAARPTPAKARQARSRAPVRARPDFKQERQFNAAVRAIISRKPTGEERTRSPGHGPRVPRGAEGHRRSAPAPCAASRPSCSPARRCRPAAIATPRADRVPVATRTPAPTAPRAPTPVEPTPPAPPAETPTPVATPVAGGDARRPTPVETPTTTAPALAGGPTTTP